MTAEQIIQKVKSGDTMVIKNYIEGWEEARDTAENLLNRSKYNMQCDVYSINVENGLLTLGVVNN